MQHKCSQSIDSFKDNASQSDSLLRKCGADKLEQMQTLLKQWMLNVIFQVVEYLHFT